MTDIARLGAGPHGPTRWQQVKILFGLNALYVGFGLVMGVVNGGLPTVMRAQGMEIGSAGWLYLLYLPFGLTFLWAPFVDRNPVPWISRQLGWIAAMQGVAVSLLVIIAFAEGTALWILFALGLSVAVAIATMDIALDAQAVRSVSENWRPTAAATKLASLSAGAMLGGGAFVAMFSELGWRTVFLLVALLLTGFLAPALVLIPRDEPTGIASGSAPAAGAASLLRLLSVPALRRRLVLLTIACCVLFPASGLNRLMLVDIGVPLQEIGWLVGTLGPLSMLAISIVSIPLMQSIGLQRSLLAFMVLVFAALAALGYGYLEADRMTAIAGAVAIGAAVSGIYVVIAAKILGWAAGSQPATDYAAYYGISRFASTLATIAAAQAVSMLGWDWFYALVAAAMLAATFILYPLTGRET
ncbi:hypothetical protein NUH88_15920 [Nisaea acidiphila]|uniref:MFS transporter n=1 Tax=Nisaea acidiphila TaxID=1862145 RepID=A0A9J7APP3_9PROT|nr:MFS transporter [Nisaea acidiphila]UUX48882.1 hypothetical protein NUH88_15920 [Nisaea acidiphila]